MMHLKSKFPLIIGPLIFIIMVIIGAPEGIPKPAYWVLASTIWIAIWWVTEPIPIPMTSLLPMILFPLSGAVSMNEIVVPYSKSIIFLFIGGFILALAMEKWNLHRRIALSIIAKVGTNQRQIILGFVIATGFLSMWISNTATTLMMLPIALSIITQFQSFEEGDNTLANKGFGKALVLCIAYSASIGGMATLVGTPTNLIFAEGIKEYYQVEIPFAQWFAFGLPISIVLLVVCWWHLSYNTFSFSNLKMENSYQLIQNQLNALGKITKEENRVLVVFSIVALSWIGRRYLINPFLPTLNDTHIALIGALLLFIIPAPSKEKEALMDWETALKLPWGILLLFGGAFAVALGFEKSGLTTWIGEQLNLLENVPFWVILLVIVAGVNFLTEITQNMATCTLMIPILAALSGAIDVHPYGLMAATCIAASCAFMLPFATAPNAIIFGSGLFSIKEMIRAGFLLNILSIIVIVIMTYFLMPLIWNIDLQAFPVE